MSLLRVGWRYVGLSCLRVPMRSNFDSYVTGLEDMKVCDILTRQMKLRICFSSSSSSSCTDSILYSAFGK